MLSACVVTSGTPQTEPGSFLVVATDVSDSGGTLPRGPVEVHLEITAFSSDGGPDNGYNGFARLYSVPGIILVGLGDDGGTSALSQGPATYPIVGFVRGHATADLWAAQVYGETVFWVSQIDAMAGGSSAGAIGESNPICYGYETLASVHSVLPLPTAFVSFGIATGEDAGRCVRPTVDLIVTAVGTNYAVVTDLDTYEPDSGLPAPGFDPATGVNDLAGSWGSLYVYGPGTSALSLGARLASLSGSVQSVAGNIELDAPAWTIASPGSQPWALPNPVAFDPSWCGPREAGLLTSNALLCSPPAANLNLPSLESSLVSISAATLPSRWLNCDLDGNGIVPYRSSSGCMPQTMGTFCSADAGGFGCPAGQDCVANECLLRCQSSNSCSVADGESCVDGHCQNACMCRAYCGSMVSCSELHQYAMSGEYDVSIGADDGGIWKVGVNTSSALPWFSPPSNPGLFVSFRNGFLVNASTQDPPWLLVTRIPGDVCCTAPGCDRDAGLPSCP